MGQIRVTGELLNRLTASSSISKSESDSDDEVFAIQALFTELSDNQKVFI